MAWPPDSIQLAAARWVALLRETSVSRAGSLLRHDSRYLDLTPTQYAAGLQWLRDIAAVITVDRELLLRAPLGAMTDRDCAAAIFRDALEATHPVWLQDADLWVTQPSELPADVTALAGFLGVDDEHAYAAIHQVHGKIDLELRKAVGTQGEESLAAAIDTAWPGSVSHVALESDGLGYDVSASVAGVEWHLEVKSTPRRGRLRIFLSRHEYEVGSRDPHWRLVVAGLDATHRLSTLGTVRGAVLAARAPRDVHERARWSAVRFDLRQADLDAGVTFLGHVPESASADVQALLRYGGDGRSRFDWMPTAPVMQVT